LIAPPVYLDRYDLRLALFPMSFAAVHVAFSRMKLSHKSALHLHLRDIRSPSS
jgi:hypothetical protein